MRRIPKSCSVAATPVGGVQQIRTGCQSETVEDILAVEEPMEIRVNTRSVSVTMRTPGHDKELAAGFLFTEGMIHQRADIVDIGPCTDVLAREKGNILNVTLADGVDADLEKLSRHVFASSSCGLCGKASIANIQMQFPAIESGQEEVPLEVVQRLPGILRPAQSIFSLTGGVHASAIFDFSGNPVVIREDVGRHNAVDKVVGYGLLENCLPFSRHILLVSGRASFEILQKALAARIPVVAAVSAPSSLAVEFARSNGQTLIGFLRDQSLNIYTCPERIG